MSAGAPTVEAVKTINPLRQNEGNGGGGGTGDGASIGHPRGSAFQGVAGEPLQSGDLRSAGDSVEEALRSQGRTRPSGCMAFGMSAAVVVGAAPLVTMGVDPSLIIKGLEKAAGRSIANSTEWAWGAAAGWAALIALTALLCVCCARRRARAQVPASVPAGAAGTGTSVTSPLLATAVLDTQRQQQEGGAAFTATEHVVVQSSGT